MERSKFNVSKSKESRTFDGITFDSAVEMRYYRDFVIPNFNDGVISYYELQKKYILQPKFFHGGKSILPITYVADFYIEFANGEIEVIDIKGCPDSVAKLKRKLFWFQYPDINFRWVYYSKIDGGWCDYEYVQEKRKERKRLKQSKN